MCLLKFYSTYQLRILPTFAPCSCYQKFMYGFLNVIKHQSFHVFRIRNFPRSAKHRFSKLPKVALRYVVILNLVDILVFLLGVDSSSTTSSASPMPNSYDALEGGSYPGNLFGAYLMFISKVTDHQLLSNMNMYYT